MFIQSALSGTQQNGATQQKKGLSQTRGFRSVKFKFMLLGMDVCVHACVSQASPAIPHMLSLNGYRSLKAKISRPVIIRHRWESSHVPCRFDPPPLHPQLTPDHAPAAIERKKQNRREMTISKEKTIGIFSFKFSWVISKNKVKRGLKKAYLL